VGYGPGVRALRFVAVGDSLTQGKGDAHPDGRPRGFADLVALALRDAGRPVSYANLARPSVRVHEVLAHQVPAATASAPDLVTAVAGVNDVIAVRFDADRLARRVDALLGGLRAGAPGAALVTAALPDLSHVSAVARAWRHRVAALNAATAAAAERHGAVLVDLGAGPPMVVEELALDRVHPSPLGHLRFARAVAAALGVEVAAPAHMAPPPRAARLHRAYRTAVATPRFVAKRLARRSLIAGQPPKRPDLHPL
jgi:lysophospholipase L1-like esterase